MTTINEYTTPDNLQYQFFPACGTSLKFSVKAKNDARVALTSSPTDSDKIIEIFIGGWGNKKSAIRLNKQTPDVVCIETPDIVTDAEYRDFILTWSGNTISLSSPSQPDLLRWENPESFPITHYGISTGWGAVGSWKIVISIGRWAPATKGEVPADAVSGGFDNEPLFVARANFNGATIPGKLVPSHQLCYIAWGGKEHGIEDYEVLCGYNTEWVKSSEGSVPPGAIPGGSSESGETLYIARVDHQGTMTIGKVHPSHNSAYIPYGGEEVPYADYEVLVLA